MLLMVSMEPQYSGPVIYIVYIVMYIVYRQGIDSSGLSMLSVPCMVSMET